MLAQDQLEKALGVELTIDNLKGNPLRGFWAQSVALARDGEVIAQGDRVELHLSLRSLLAGDPALSLLRLKGLTFDLACLDGQNTGGCPTLPRGLRHLELIDSELVLGGERVHLARAVVENRGPQATFDGEGRFRDLPFRAQLKLLFADGGLSLDRSSLTVGESRLEGQGQVLPALDLDLKAFPLDFDTLSGLLPQLAKAGVKGRPDVTARVTGPPERPAMTGSFHLLKGEAIAIALENFRSSWSWQKGRLDFTGIATTANGSPVAGDLGLIFRESLELDLDLKGENLSIERWQRAFPWLSFAEGTLETLTVDLEGPTGALRGSVRFDGASARIAGQEGRGLRADLDLDGAGSIAVDGGGLWASSPVDVTGTVLLDEATTLDLRFTSKALALNLLRTHFGWLDPLLPEGNLAGTFVIEGPSSSPAYRGQIRSDRIRIRRTLLEDFEALFTLRGDQALIEKASGRWQGASLSASGSLYSISSGEKTTLAVTGTVKGLSLSALPLNGFDLRGRAEGTWRAEGPLSAPRLVTDLTVKEMAFAGLPGGTFAVKAGYDGQNLTLQSFRGPLLDGEISGSGRVGLGEKPTIKLVGDFAAMALTEKILGGTLPEGTVTSRLSGGYLLEGPLDSPALLLNVREGKGTAWDVPVASVQGRVSLDSKGFRIEKALLSLLGGQAAVSGSVRDEDRFSLKADLESLDLTTFPGRDGLAFTLGGSLSGSLLLTGDDGKRGFRADLAVPRLKVGDFSLTDVTAQATGDEERLEIRGARGLIGTSPVEAQGSFALAPLRGTFSLAGKELDLAVFASAADPARTGGLFNLNVDGQIGPDSFSGTGALTSPSLRLSGLRVDDFQAPFIVQDRYLTIEDGRGSFYGGTIRTQWSLGIDETLWGGNLSVKGFDLARALADGFDLEGSLSGTTDLDLRLSGTYGRAMLLDGQGSLSIVDGQVEGFSALSKVGGPLPYRSLNINYVIDGRTLYLLPGSRAAAPSGNSLYRYLSFDGSLTPGKEIDLNGYGELNLQSFGALIGAISKLAAAETPQGLAQGFLSGLLGGVTGRDFREISFALAGDWEAPVLKDVKVHQAPARATPIPEGARDPKDRGDGKQFSFRLEFPTGEGAEKADSEMGSQITQQILDQILLQLLGDDEDSPEDGSFFN